MSYSFVVRAATKGQASEQVAAELAKVVLSQPIHEKDQRAAQATADAYIALLADDPNQDINVSMNGSTWNSGSDFQQANVSVQVQLYKRGE